MKRMGGGEVGRVGGGEVGRMGGRAACVLIALAIASGCGYSLAGRGNFLPDYIKVIAIPDFVNQSTAANIDVAVTKAAREEFQSRGGRYRIVVDEANADASLVGTILSVTPTPASFSAQGQASRYRISVIAKVEFVDRHENKTIWSNPAMQFSEEYDVTTSLTANDVNAFFGQDANAMQRLAKSFARSLIASILENF